MKEEVGINTQIFERFLDGKYIMGYDPYDSINSSENLGYTILTIPKRKFGIKKQRGFRRIVELGWEYVMKLKV